MRKRYIERVVPGNWKINVWYDAKVLVGECVNFYYLLKEILLIHPFFNVHG